MTTLNLPQVTEFQGVLIISIICILWISISLYHENKRKKAISKAWKDAREHFANRLIDSSYWIKDNPQFHNYLWIMAHNIKTFGHYDIDNIRKQILKLGNTKVHDLPIEQRKEYFPK